MVAEQQPHSEPVYVVNALESAWNERDSDALAGLFDEDAVLVLEPSLEQAAAESRYEGAMAIRDLLRQHVPGGSIATRGLAVEGHKASWHFEMASDRLRGLAVPGAAGEARATIRNGKIQELWLSFSPETVGLLRAARGQRPR